MSKLIHYNDKFMMARNDVHLTLRYHSSNFARWNDELVFAVRNNCEHCKCPIL